MATTAVEKQDGSLVLVVHLTLRAGRDDALIRLVQSAPPRGLAGVVREAMRSGTRETLDEAYEDAPEEFALPDIDICL